MRNIVARLQLINRKPWLGRMRSRPIRRTGLPLCLMIVLSVAGAILMFILCDMHTRHAEQSRGYKGLFYYFCKALRCLGSGFRE